MTRGCRGPNTSSIPTVSTVHTTHDVETNERPIRHGTITIVTTVQIGSQLSGIIQKLHADLEQNEKEVEKIDAFISPYSTAEAKKITADHNAVISIILKDLKTITSLKELTKTLAAWNRVLPLYHQLLKNESRDGNFGHDLLHTTE